jgi:hypothetical protein
MGHRERNGRAPTLTIDTYSGHLVASGDKAIEVEIALDDAKVIIITADGREHHWDPSEIRVTAVASPQFQLEIDGERCVFTSDQPSRFLFTFLPALQEAAAPADASPPVPKIPPTAEPPSPWAFNSVSGDTDHGQRDTQPATDDRRTQSTAPVRMPPAPAEPLQPAAQLESPELDAQPTIGTRQPDMVIDIRHAEDAPPEPMVPPGEPDHGQEDAAETRPGDQRTPAWVGRVRTMFSRESESPPDCTHQWLPGPAQAGLTTRICTVCRQVSIEEHHEVDGLFRRTPGRRTNTTTAGDAAVTLPPARPRPEPEFTPPRPEPVQSPARSELLREAAERRRRSRTESP